MTKERTDAQWRRSVDRMHKRIVEHGDPRTGERVTSTRARELAAGIVRRTQKGDHNAQSEET